MDQNWYTQDLSPRPPKRRSYLWVWILGGCLFFFGMLAAFIAFVVSHIPAGKDFGDFLAESIATDNSEAVSFRDSDAARRLEAAKAAYIENRIASDDVTSEEVVAIESFLKHMTTVIQADDDVAFAAEMSLLEYKDRVRLAPSLSFTARGQFREQFDEWFALYSPYSGAVSRIQLVSIKRDSSDHQTLIAWTWLFNSEYPDRVAWYLRSNGTDMRLVDFEILDTSALSSDDTARQFSGAFTGAYWNNYLAILDHDVSAATTPEAIAEARAEILRQNMLPISKSVARLAWYRQALKAIALHDNDLCLQMLAKTEELAQIPAVYWQRAMIFKELKDYEKAETNLQQYTDLTGPGPETLRLQAEIATAQKQHEKASVAWVELLALDPDTNSLPWDFHKHIPADSGTILASTIQSRPDRVIAAQKVASLLVSRDRSDLAEPLLLIAESGSNPTSELFALRAELATLDDDDEAYLTNLESAWTAADQDHPSRASWIYKWAEKMISAGKGAEAIAQSPDPGQTFYNFAVDEDGYLILNARQLEVLSSALQEANASDTSAAKWLKVWKRLAPVTVPLKRRDYNAVWQSLSTLLSKEAPDDDRQVSDLLTELELKWTVEDWLATAAIETRHVAEAWELLPEETRLSSMMWKIDEADSLEGITQIIDKLRSNNAADGDLIYCEGLAAELRKENAPAIQKYREFLQHPKFEESTFLYQCKNRLANLVIDQPDWKTSIADLPANWLCESLAQRLRGKNRYDDALAVIELAREHGATLAETVVTEAMILKGQKNWDGLCQLCDRWLAEKTSADDLVASNRYGLSAANRAFFDAWIATQQFDRAEQFLAQQTSDQYDTADWKLTLAVARNDQKAAESVFADAAANSTSSPDIAELGESAGAIWSDEWREFRRRHPVSLHNISNSSSYSQAVLLRSSAVLSSAISTTTETLRAALSSVDENVVIDELTDVLTQAEQRAISFLSATELQPGTRQLFRAGLHGSTYLIFTGSDQYHKPVGSTSDDDGDATLLEEEPFSDSLKQAIDQHQGWICLTQESTASDASSPEEQFAQITAALIDESTTVVNVGYETAPVSAALKSMLADGIADDLPEAVVYSPPGADPLVTALNTKSGPRLRALRKRLNEIQNGAEIPKITLLLAMPGLWQRDQMMIECRLLKWEPLEFPSTWTLDLSNSPLVPPKFHGELAEASTFSVLDWREE